MSEDTCLKAHNAQTAAGVINVLIRSIVEH